MSIMPPDDPMLQMNALNQAFYAMAGEDFDESRGRPWPGWARLIPYATAIPRAPVRILDVGCGNGRFGRFAARQFSQPTQYHGMDNNPTLLEAARNSFSKMSIYSDAILEARDIVVHPPDSGEYDVVAAFGVLHHVPGHARRLALVRALAERVAAGGILVFTGWCFYEYERFRERLIMPPPAYHPEPGDWLMDWRRGHAANTALRYCHYIDDQGHAGLMAAAAHAGLTPCETFRADGHTDDINRYGVLRRDA
jgi:SAM-dependent methyltransferase